MKSTHYSSMLKFAHKGMSIALMIGILVPAQFLSPVVPTAEAATANGIEVHRAPAWHIFPSGVELFINEPKHNQPAGTYNLASVPFQYRLRYGVCYNRYPQANVYARYDYNGTQCQPDTNGTNAYWIQAYKKIFRDRNCNGGQSGKYCLVEVSDNTTLNLSNVAPTTSVVTLQVYAKWIYNYVKFPITDDSPTGAGLSYPENFHVVNICINVKACGNGRVESGEQCDDGNRNDGDGCSNQCVTEQKLIIRKVSSETSVVAGQPVNYTIFVKNPNNFTVAANSIVYDQPGANLTITSVPSFCSVSNNLITCNIGHLVAGQEISIPVSMQTAAGTQCPGTVYNTATSYIGNVKQGEATASTQVTCRAPQCGNGQVESGEQCDDGNTNNTDSCTNACKNAVCGDSIIQSGEQCDDGNTSNGDGCSNSCQVEQTPKTDVRIVKTTTGTNPVDSGGTTTFKIEVKNISNVTAENVTVTDAAVPGIYPTQVTSPCTIANNAVTCNFGTLTPDQVKTATVTANISKTAGGVCSPGTLTNTAVVTTTTEESVTTNNTSSSNVNVECPAPLADVTIVKDTLAADVLPGEFVDFAIIPSNIGGTPAQNVTVTDTLPTQLDFVSASNGCSAAGRVITCQVGNLGSGQVGNTIQVRTKLNNTATSGMTVVNPAHVATTSTESNYNNNDDEASFRVGQIPKTDITVIKTTTGTNPVVNGGTTTFTIEVKNLTNVPAENVVMNDPAVAGIYPTQVTSPCTIDNNTINCNLGTLQGNETKVITVTATISKTAGGVCSTGSHLNRANVTTTSAETSTSNNTSSSTISVTCPPTQADVVVTKIGPGTITRGDVVTYTLTAKNNGPASAANVVVTDTPPAGMTYIDAQSDSRCDLSGGNVVCNVGTLADDQQTSITLKFQTTDALACSQVTNRASIATSTAETDADNNLAIMVSNVDCPPTQTDISVTKTPETQSKKLGEVASWTLLVRNHGAISAQNVVLTDTLPAGLGAPITAPNCSISGQVITCNIGTMTSGQNASFNISATVVAPATVGQTLTNRANVVTSTPETRSDNNEDTATVTIVETPVLTGCIDITKETFNSNGQIVTPVIPFTFKLDGNQTTTNDSNGIARFNNVPAGTHTISEIIPSGWTQLLVTPANGTVVVPAGTNCVSVNFKNKMVAGSSSSNSSSSSSSTSSSSSSSNSSSSFSSSSSSTINGCIEITKTAYDVNNNPLYTVPQFTFTLDGNRTAQNDSNGRARFDNVPSGTHTVIENVPTGWSLTTVSPNNGTINVNGGSACAQIFFSNRQNPLTNNDFTISKTDHESEVEPGDDLTYEIKVRNNSNQTVNNVTVTDTLPDEVIFDSCTKSCSRNGRTLTWSNQTFAPNEEKTYEVDVEVDEDADGTLINNAYVFDKSARDETDVEEVDDEDDDDETDIELIKESNTSEVFPGGVIEYTVRIENIGDNTIEDLTVTDKLPSGASVVDAGNGKRKGSTLVWEIDELEDGDTWTATYRLAADAGLMPGTILRNEVCVEDENEDIDECEGATVSVIGNLPQTGYRNGGSAIQLRAISRGGSNSASSAALPLGMLISMIGLGTGAGMGAARKFLLGL